MNELVRSPGLASTQTTRMLAPFDMTVSNPMMTTWPYPRWIAHRGGGHIAPENTLPALRTALRWGWQMMECDVKLSADDVPYLMHDETLERTTSGSGPADALCWAELAKLDAGHWHSEWFRHTPPAALAEVATLLRRTGATLNLEIKPMPNQGARTGHCVAEAVARLWAGSERFPLMSSFDPEALQACAQTAPHLPRALLIDQERSDLWQQAQQLHCQAVVLQHHWVRREHIQQAHNHHMQVVAYTVNTVDEAQRLIEIGVASLITDSVSQLRPDTDDRAQLR